MINDSASVQDFIACVGPIVPMLISISPKFNPNNYTVWLARENFVNSQGSTEYHCMCKNLIVEAEVNF